MAVDAVLREDEQALLAGALECLRALRDVRDKIVHVENLGRRAK